MEIKYNTDFEVLTENGFKPFSGIRKSTTNKILKITFSDLSVLECTEDHLLILSDFSTIEACNLTNEVLYNGLTLFDKEEIVKEISVYDLLDVETNNAYFTNNVLSHNCSFLGSSYTLISAKYIANMAEENPIMQDSQIKIFKKPMEDRSYLVSCDPAEGKNQDYSCFIVFDITEYPFTIAAIFRDNTISPNIWPNVIYQVAHNYNSAPVIIENNNSPQVAYILHHELEYENVVTPIVKGSDIGIKTSKSTKKLGCTNFKDLVENQKMVINDVELISEISTFVQQSNGTCSCDPKAGEHDDLVMCCVLASYFMTTDYFKQMHDMDIRKTIRKNHEDHINDNLLPMGFVTNGLNDHDVLGYDLSDDQRELLLTPMYYKNLEKIPDKEKKTFKDWDKDKSSILGYLFDK